MMQSIIFVLVVGFHVSEVQPLMIDGFVSEADCIAAGKQFEKAVTKHTYSFGTGKSKIEPGVTVFCVSTLNRVTLKTK